MVERPCAGCGRVFTAKRAHARYCSAACCSWRAHHSDGELRPVAVVCCECGTDISDRQRGARKCVACAAYKPVAPKYSGKCQRCGASWAGHRPNQKFCSDACGRIAGRERLRQPTELSCDHCTKTFVGVNWGKDAEHKHRYCSVACFGDAKRWAYMIRSVPIRWACRIEDRSWYIVRGRRRFQAEGPSCRVKERPAVIRWIAGRCPECSTLFVGRWHPKWPCRYCSDSCAHRSAARVYRKLHGRSDDHRHRARKFGVAYEPVSRCKLFERDGYRCGICGGMTDRGKKVPHPRAPTIDHIIPLSQGGEHSYLNTQCACFRCNTLKGARAANDQLRLVA